jgi:PAS domain S-box-containing protein
MARNGSVMFGALAIGAFFLDCERGIARLVTSGDSGGIMARRMAVATVASLFVLGGIAIWAVKSTVIAIEIATACLVVASIVVMCVLILATASALHRLEKARQADNIALQESAHQLQLATDAAELGVWTWNPADNEVFCSEQAKKIFGIEKDGALFAYPFLLSRVHPEDRERVRLNGMKEASTEYMNEYRIVRHDGTTGWVALRGRRFGNTVDSSMIGVISDITDRKLSEDALVRNEKLASVGRMAASIAHEINNPLAAVMNLLYLCRSDASLSPNSQRLLLDAEAELGRVAHITRQTLGFYREHASPAYVVMADLVKQTCDFYRYRAEQSRITIDVRLRSSVSTVYANAGEIRQVISNLLVNGLDSMSSGGTLHLRLAQIGSTVRITVADVGCGIDTKYNNRIFEPFFTTKETTGTGLGLWICRQIIERHGGKIRMRSKRQKGTVFVVSLPASAAPRAAAAIAP